MTDLTLYPILIAVLKNLAKEIPSPALLSAKIRAAEFGCCCTVGPTSSGHQLTPKSNIIETSTVEEEEEEEEEGTTDFDRLVGEEDFLRGLVCEENSN